MLAIKLAHQRAKAPPKLMGLPPRPSKNVRMLFENTDKTNEILGVDVNFDRSGISPWSAAADAAQAVAIERQVAELVRSLTLNGVPEPQAREQADQMLNTVSRGALATVLENRGRLDRETARAAATTTIVNKLSAISDAVLDNGDALRDSASAASAASDVEISTGSDPARDADESFVRSLPSVDEVVAFLRSGSFTPRSGRNRFRRANFPENSAAAAFAQMMEDRGLMNWDASHRTYRVANHPAGSYANTAAAKKSIAEAFNAMLAL